MNMSWKNKIKIWTEVENDKRKFLKAHKNFVSGVEKMEQMLYNMGRIRNGGDEYGVGNGVVYKA